MGQLIRHRLFDYRGVIIDVDPHFQGDDAWYEQMAKTRPPKDLPWYHVLVHNAVHQTYVAEQHLQPDASGERILHPLIDVYFDRFVDGRYQSRSRTN